MEALRTAQGHPGWLVRFVVGIIGSAVPLIGPFIVKFAVFEASSESITAAARVGAVSTMALMILAWCLSVVVTTFMPEDHLLKTVLGSLGIPGVIVSGAVGLQALQ